MNKILIISIITQLLPNKLESIDEFFKDIQGHVKIGRDIKRISYIHTTEPRNTRIPNAHSPIGTKH